MDTAQHVFYIIGSIALGLFALFLLIGIIVVLAIRQKIARVTTKMHFIADEFHSIIKSGKSYGRYISAAVSSGVLGAIIRMLRRRRNYY